MNPIEDYLDDIPKFASERAEQDFEAWHAWKQAPEEQKREALQVSINRFNPLIQSKLRQWGTAPQVNPAALHLELVGAVQHAHDTFKPTMGATFNTWVNTNIQRALKLVQKSSNLAGASAERQRLVGPLQRAQDQLMGQLGREPTDAELATSLGQTEKTVRNVRMDISRADISSSSFSQDPVELYAQQSRSPIAMDVLSLMEQRPVPGQRDIFKTQRDREVFELARGIGGKPKMEQKGQIAKRLGVSPATVTRSFQAIKKVFDENT
jgi:DNA-directed RNA polymerase specialized sigma subunit